MYVLSYRFSSCCIPETGLSCCPDVDFCSSDYMWLFYYIHTHTRLTAPFSGTTRVSRYQKGKTNLDFPEARDSEWQWHRLGHMQVCTSLHTDNHASTRPLSFLQAGCPSCGPTNSIKALKAYILVIYVSMCITDEHEVNRNFVLMVFHYTARFDSDYWSLLH